MIGALAGSVGLAAGDPAFWMPLAFLALFLLILTAGVIFDGFDIGIGCLALFAPPSQRDHMLGLLSPWRDANSFWLFLGAGLLLTAFPAGWERIAAQLYGPLSLLGLGVLLRSACYELRLRSPAQMRGPWTRGFIMGSLATALAHGIMLAEVVGGTPERGEHLWFGLFLALCTLAAYSLLGASWLIMRVTGELRIRALVWARRAVRWTAAGTIALTIVPAASNTGVLLKWGAPSGQPLVLAVWTALLLAFVGMEMCLQRMINHSYRTTAVPFFITLFVLATVLWALSYSFFPFLVLDEVTVWDAAANVETLRPVLSAAIVALPVALIFNLWIYRHMLRRVPRAAGRS